MFLANAEYLTAGVRLKSTTSDRTGSGPGTTADWLTGTGMLSGGAVGGGSWPSQHPGCPVQFEGGLESYSLTPTFPNPSNT